MPDIDTLISQIGDVIYHGSNGLYPDRNTAESEYRRHISWLIEIGKSNREGESYVKALLAFLKHTYYFSKYVVTAESFALVTDCIHQIAHPIAVPDELSIKYLDYLQLGIDQSKKLS